MHKFFKIKNHIINLEVIRGVSYNENCLYIDYCCGDQRTERIILESSDEAMQVFHELYHELTTKMKEVKLS